MSARRATPRTHMKRNNKVIAKIITILIAELVAYRSEKYEGVVNRDIQNAIDSLKTIKKYF